MSIPTHTPGRGLSASNLRLFGICLSPGAWLISCVTLDLSPCCPYGNHLKSFAIGHCRQIKSLMIRTCCLMQIRCCPSHYTQPLYPPSLWNKAELYLPLKQPPGRLYPLFYRLDQIAACHFCPLSPCGLVMIGPWRKKEQNPQWTSPLRGDF